MDRRYTVPCPLDASAVLISAPRLLIPPLKPSRCSYLTKWPLQMSICFLTTGPSILQRQWRKLPPPPSPLSPFPPFLFPSPCPFPPLPRSLGAEPHPGKNGNWKRIWCILAHFCLKTAAIQCFTFCKQKLSEFFPLQGVILFPLSPIWTQVASTSPVDAPVLPGLCDRCYRRCIPVFLRRYVCAPPRSVLMLI